MKISKIKNPKMVERSTFSTRPRDEEDEMMAKGGDVKKREKPSTDIPVAKESLEKLSKKGFNPFDLVTHIDGKRIKKASGGTVESGSKDMNMAKGGVASKLKAAGYKERIVKGNKEYVKEHDDGEHRIYPNHPEGIKSVTVKDGKMSHSDHSSLEDALSDKKKLAEGGEIKDNDINELVDMDMAEEDDAPEMSPLSESYMSPDEDDFMADHFAEGGTIADKIMARHEEARRMAEGGEILSHDSIESDDSDMVDLSRNADEDANEEDQLSFDALLKENYSETDGLDDLDYDTDRSTGDSREKAKEDKLDRVDRIMRKVRK